MNQYTPTGIKWIGILRLSNPKKFFFRVWEGFKLVLGWAVYNTAWLFILGSLQGVTYACDDIQTDVLRDICKLGLHLHSMFGNTTIILILIFGILLIVWIKFPTFFSVLEEVLDKVVGKVGIKRRRLNGGDGQNYIPSQLPTDVIHNIKQLEENLERILNELKTLTTELIKLKERIRDTNENTEDINEKVSIINKSVEINTKLISELSKDIEVLKGSLDTLNRIISSMMLNLNKLIISLEEIEKLSKDIKKIKAILDSLVD